ncbi:two-component sensor histidine kinase [Kitasatospora xanthocidica]|uniref:sensor histidine kinase n=1 Tax=Kitasatospora xanthocidica TaxID=83382 RepID=UPI0019C6828F|nr:HAMP domain-containing sensor histidine kinase [Kitasatospora xanthocidica]GHF91218.1 two-component sensor histidine kinase [Kitasatospora xanthocidica]
MSTPPPSERPEPRTPRLVRLRRAVAGLRPRLLVAFVAVAALSALATAALTYRAATNSTLDLTQDTTLDELRRRIDVRAPALPFPPTQSELDVLAAELSGTGGFRDWHVLAAYGTEHSAWAQPVDVPPALRRTVDGGRAAFQRFSADGHPWLAAGVPVTYAKGGPSGLTVYAVLPLDREQSAADALLAGAAGAGAFAAVLAAGLALLAARQVLRPVRALGDAAHALAQGRLDTRLTVTGHDELAQLSKTFNHTARTLQGTIEELRAVESQGRRFAADVSHELRTPLAAMLAVTDILDEDAEHLPADTATALRMISNETVRLTRLVNDLIEISRLDAGAAPLRTESIDAATAVRETVDLRGWSDQVELDLPAALPVQLDPRRFDVIVANLAGNALRHGRPPVRLRLREADGELLLLTVTDRGPGIPPAELPHLFDRFYKADKARARSEGSGLGLAIAQENARLHGGLIEAANSPGGGAVFTLVLPRGILPEEM